MRPHPASAVTIGVYDGVHLGHRRVIDHVRKSARSQGLRSVVVTFDRHPAAVINPGSAPLLLTDLAQRLELLEATGVDEVVVLAFDERRAAESAEEFVRGVLVADLKARAVVVGEDFHFGRARAGNVALLREMGAKARFRVEPVHLLEITASHGVVSSTRIRGLVAGGDLAGAAALLGRPHEVRGEVVVGRDVRSGTAAAPESERPTVCVEIPATIQLPPAGRYPGLLDLGGGPPLEVSVVVPDHVPGPRRLCAAAAPGLIVPATVPAGERARLLFR